MSGWKLNCRPVLYVAGIIACLMFGCMPAVDAGREAEPQHVLTGKPAPLFNTTYLDGQAFDLAQHLGKEVVVLDFWATWCGPCRKAMPTLSEVTSEFNDRGVRLFAINLAEQTEDVKDFIEQSGLEIPVLMDPEGKIAEEYDAEAIPQTVLIDRQGVVRFVHVGLDPNLRQLLTEQLNTLVTESPGTSESTEAASR